MPDVKKTVVLVAEADVALPFEPWGCSGGEVPCLVKGQTYAFPLTGDIDIDRVKLSISRCHLVRFVREGTTADSEPTPTASEEPKPTP